jgi:hypothetical protein
MFYGFLALLAGCYALSWRWMRIVRFLRRRKRWTKRHASAGIAAQ